MRMSEEFGVERGPEDDWFDPILNVDTALFVDPFLVFLEEAEPWAGVYGLMMEHFNECFRLIAESGRQPLSLPYQRAVSLLDFPEPREMCLGYAARSTRGSGAARGLGLHIADAMSEAIGRGLFDLRHFEELGVLNEGIGPDRISDITCTLMKPRLIEYTQAIARRHGIRLEPHTIQAARYNAPQRRSSSARVDLPANPVTGGGIILVPERFLRELPTMDAQNWWAWHEAERVSIDLNYEVMGSVSKAAIVAAARQDPQRVRQWAEEVEGRRSQPYDLDADPRGVYRWDQASQDFAQAHPLKLTPAGTLAEFADGVDQIVAQFKLFIEEQGGWRLLWNDDDSEKPESAAQLLFLGVASHYCRANDISLDREVELGRGPVDFKFSTGYARRALLEVKKLTSGTFWNGLDHQLPSYLRSGECDDGWFLAIQLRDGGVSAERTRDLPTRVAGAAARHRKNLRYVLVDGRPRKSASKLRDSDAAGTGEGA
jgi:hypothetical protein